MAHFWKNSIYVLHVAHIYAICIYYESEFYGNFFAHNFFSKPPTQNFENWFSPKCVGKIFFRSRIRKQRKISRQMIYGDIRFIPPTPTQKELYICEILWRPRINKVPFEGLILLPSCSEGSITQEKSLIECVKPWKYRKVMFLSWKLKRPSSFL